MRKALSDSAARSRLSIPGCGAVIAAQVIVQKMSEVLMPAVDRVPEGVEWNYSTGFVSEDMVREHLFPYEDSTIAVMCGPPPMIKYVAPSSEKQIHLYAYPDQEALQRGVGPDRLLSLSDAEGLHGKAHVPSRPRSHRVLHVAETLISESAAERSHPG